MIYQISLSGHRSGRNKSFEINFLKEFYLAQKDVKKARVFRKIMKLMDKSKRQRALVRYIRYCWDKRVSKMMQDIKDFHFSKVEIVEDDFAFKPGEIINSYLSGEWVIDKPVEGVTK